MLNSARFTEEESNGYSHGWNTISISARCAYRNLFRYSYRLAIDFWFLVSIDRLLTCLGTVEAARLRRGANYQSTSTPPDLQTSWCEIKPVSCVYLGIGSEQPITILSAITVWGLTFGGAATLLQTAIAQAGGESSDVAQSMLVTVWNLAIGGGGVCGALLLELLGANFLPGSLFILLLPALIVAWLVQSPAFCKEKV